MIWYMVNNATVRYDGARERNRAISFKESTRIIAIKPRMDKRKNFRNIVAE